MHKDLRTLKRVINYTEFASANAYSTLDLLTITSGVRLIISAWVEINTSFKGSPDDYKALKVCVGRTSLVPPTQPNEFLADSSAIGSGTRLTKGSDFATRFTTLSTTGSFVDDVKIRLRDGDGDLGAGDLPLDHLVQGQLTVYVNYIDLED